MGCGVGPSGPAPKERGGLSVVLFVVGQASNKEGPMIWVWTAVVSWAVTLFVVLCWCEAGKRADDDSEREYVERMALRAANDLYRDTMYLH